MTHDPAELPDQLPVPVDDGAADHLVGTGVPSIVLPSTGGGGVDLSGQSRRQRIVVFAYPRTGRPGVEPPAGWDEIPGARGCTPEACAFRDLAAEFAAVNTVIYGLSTQDTDYQSEAVTRLGLPYDLLSDADLALTEALRLPTFVVDGTTLLCRLTLVVDQGMVRHALYPVFPPDQAAADVLAVLRNGSLTA
jgi:peroxiredoxin